jgi:P2 family phage contractile tail tube protein
MDGLGSLLGRAEEFNAPVVKTKNAEHKALGMVGVAEFFSGIDKMEAKVKWNSFYADVMRKTANPVNTVKLQLRSSIENYTADGRGAQVPLVIFMTVQFKDFPLGNFKQHDNVELEQNMTVYYYRMEIDGEVITEVDVLSNILKVNGVDLLADYRANLGI